MQIDRNIEKIFDVFQNPNIACIFNKIFVSLIITHVRDPSFTFNII